MQGVGAGAAGLSAGAGMSGNLRNRGVLPSPGIGALFFVTGTAGTVIVPVNGWADIFLKGGHGGGATGFSDTGGRGAAAYKRVYVKAGQALAYGAAADGVFVPDDDSVPNAAGDGGTSQVTLPDGRTVSATGGFGAGSDQGPRNSDGAAFGGDINRAGASAGFTDLVSPLSWSGPGVLIIVGKNST